ncbi:hypothetical protein HNR46_003783 [Haloferula luteola]|uniref:Uncharacterized protein n=1 Tax=Haloferula luteola TaxID=595692 RepID=A0A840V6C6_9BACT|nr:hypothetical protein [Haloferula luteola]MBB5353522.1 hypothetical protein [Haloferula luteola]
MSWWNRSVYEQDTELAADLSYPPTASPGKQILLGLLLPCLIGVFAFRGWQNEEIIWFGEHQPDWVRGAPARWIALGYGGAALFCHFRWLWGARGFYRIFELGTILALLMILGGCGTGMVKCFL